MWQRAQPGPAFDTPIADIIDFLVELGQRLDLATNPYLQEALEATVKVSELGRRILVNCYDDMRFMFSREQMQDEVVLSLGSTAVIDGWLARDVRA